MRHRVDISFQSKAILQSIAHKLGTSGKDIQSVPIISMLQEISPEV